MPDQRILDYLNQNLGKYPLEHLKQALVQNGFSIEEVEEAVAIVSGHASSAPGAPNIPPAPGSASPGAAQGTSTGSGRVDAEESLSAAWSIYKTHAGVFIVGLIIMVGASMGVGVVGEIGLALIRSGTDSQAVVLAATLVLQVVSIVVQTFLTLGAIKMGLKAVRGQTPEIGDMFTQGGKLVSGILANLLVGLVCFLGFLLLIVPGIIAALMFSFTLWFVVERDLGPIDAMKASMAAASGQKLNLFLLFLVLALLTLVGMIPCCLGLLITGPLWLIAVGHAYVQVEQKV